jgi:DNA mismatch endonuclease, patch repair protein
MRDRPALFTSGSDPLSQEDRSKRMSLVRAKGNRSTEELVAQKFMEIGIAGWERHVKLPGGRPDFYFSSENLAVFVDGCFWHSCPKCARRIPASRKDFWMKKLEDNRKRDARTRRRLRKAGIRTMRIWEHELRAESWLLRVQARLASIRGESVGDG